MSKSLSDYWRKERMIEIKVYPDGDQTCAIIGNMPESVCVGFGENAKEAIINMLSEMDAYRKFCPICLQEADETYEYTTEVQYCCSDGHKWTEHE
jgi:hypothetical protein